MNKKLCNLKKIIKLLPRECIKSPAMELGSGSGILSIAIRSIFRNLKITAIDKNISKMPPCIIRRYRKYNIELKENDVTTMKCPSNSIATIFIYQFLHHLPSSQHNNFFQKIYNILKDRGYLIIIESFRPVYKVAQQNFLRINRIEARIDQKLGEQPEYPVMYNNIVEKLHQSGFIIIDAKKFLTFHDKISRNDWIIWRRHLIKRLKLVREKSEEDFNYITNDLRALDKRIAKEGLEEIPLTLLICKKINYEKITPVRKSGTKIRKEGENEYLMINKFAKYMLVVNEIALYIYGLINGKNKINEIVQNIIKKTNADKCRVWKDVKRAVALFAEFGYIDIEDSFKS